MKNTPLSVIREVLILIGLLAMLGVLLPSSAYAARPTFDHLTTGFPLTGAHAQANCESCHLSGVFRGTPTQCVSCHTVGSGRALTAKPANHFPTTAPCDECHRSTVTWAGARFSHAAIAPGSCMRCHNGSIASGKPANHVMTTASCDMCHRTSAWVPASFNHTSVTPGTCANCHNGTQATGKPNGHFVTTRSCDACHTTSAWTPVLTYSHISPYYSTHRSGVRCADCHTTNSEVISWPYAAYKPDCAGCHANRFKADAHKKVDSPTTYYTVSELRNCTGACHTYTDSTLTTISKSRSGHHHSTDGGWD